LRNLHIQGDSERKVGVLVADNIGHSREKSACELASECEWLGGKRERES